MMKHMTRLAALILALLLPGVSACAESVPTLTFTMDAVYDFDQPSNIPAGPQSLSLTLGFEQDAVSALLNLDQNDDAAQTQGLRLENGTLYASAGIAAELLPGSQYGSEDAYFTLNPADLGLTDAFRDGIAAARNAVDLIEAVQASDSLDFNGWLYDTFESDGELIYLTFSADELPGLVASFLAADKAAAAAWDELAPGLNGLLPDAALDALLSLSEDGFELEGGLAVNGESIPFSVTGLSDGESCLLSIALDKANLTVTLTDGMAEISYDLDGASVTASAALEAGLSDGPVWLPEGREINFGEMYAAD